MSPQQSDRRSGSETHSVGEILSGAVTAALQPRPLVPDEHPSAVPSDWRELDLGMSNFEHTIDEGLADALRDGGSVYSRHAAWNFNGLVWFDAESGDFKEEVWRFHEPQAPLFAAPTLELLMEAVNDNWGWD